MVQLTDYKNKTYRNYEKEAKLRKQTLRKTITAVKQQ